jgi:hypothetical protein
MLEGLKRMLGMGAAVDADSFNADLLAAVTKINADWAAKGYDINSYFSHNLTYGPDCCINANHPPKTMCVAAVMEVIVAALTAWYAQSNDRRPFEKLPIRSWRGGSRRDIRAHIFMYDGLGCNGTAHALERFGIGRQLPFSDLVAGDVINFNRTSGSGHSCIFLAYLDATGNDVAAFGPSVQGFRYFSAQGQNTPDGGFGYRWAFFNGTCPTLSGGRKRDCGVIRSNDPKLLCCGRMLHPSKWPERTQIEEGVRRAVRPQAGPEARGPAYESELERELPAPDLSRFNGVTTD